MTTRVECFMCGGWRPQEEMCEAWAVGSDEVKRSVLVCDRCRRKIEDEGPRRVLRDDGLSMVRAVGAEGRPD